jgi:O-antigen/teichoic acid export membrane protein
MSQPVDIRSNSFFAFVSQGTRLLTNALVFVGIARFFGPEEFGQFTAAHTLSVIFLLIADFGFDRLLTWEIARGVGRARDLADRYFTAKVVFATLVVAVMAILAVFQYASVPTRQLALIMTVYTLVSSLTNFFFALFKGFEQFQHETKISFVSNLLLLVMVLVLGFLRAPLITFAGAFVLSRLVALVLAGRLSRSRFSIPGIRLALPSRESMGLIVLFGVNQIFATLFFTQDTILLAMWRGDYEVGIYQAVFKLVALCFIVPDVLFQTFLPTLSRLYGEQRLRWELLGKVLNKTLFFVGLPLASMLFLYADHIIHLVYGGSGFDEAIPILRVFAGVTLFHFFGITNAVVLISTNRVRLLTMILVSATVLNAGLNAYMIPRYGPWGAAMVSLGTMIFVAFAYVHATRNVSRRWVREARYLVPPGFVALAFPLLWFLRDDCGWWPAIPVVLLYGVVTLRLGYTTEERRLLLEAPAAPSGLARAMAWLARRVRVDERPAEVRK